VASLKERIRPYYLRWLYFRVAPGARPPNFVSCWRYPFRRLGQEAADLLPAPGEHPDVVWYPMTDWHARMQRTQYLARALAQLGHRSLYVNPHLGRQFETTRLSDPRHRISLLEPNLVELHVRLPREPVFHHRMLDAGESRTVAAAVTEGLGAASPAGAVQILSLPIWLDAAIELRTRYGWRIVYDCHDLLSGFSNMAPQIVAAEERVFGEADRIVFSSETLLRRHERWSGKAVLVRNGVDAARFAAETPPGDSARVVGYVGAIEEWFDIAAVLEAAAANPDLQFVLAGRIENPAAAQLSRLPNVRMPGEVAYGEVPALMRQFRVGLIPFKVNDLTRAADPIKMYEYFACGLPVVSAPLPEVEPYGDLVYLASGPAEFAAAVRDACREDDARLRERRIAVARGAGWMERARELRLAATGPGALPSVQA
jgi:glycosyltransferase involved in cell wall biosynthesis